MQKRNRGLCCRLINVALHHPGVLEVRFLDIKKLYEQRAIRRPHMCKPLHSGARSAHASILDSGSDSTAYRVLIVLITCILMCIGSCGCDTESTESSSNTTREVAFPQTREFWLRNWEVSIREDRLSPRHEEHVNKIMATIRDAKQPIELCLLEASYGCNRDETACSIIVYPYDETGSLAGIRVHEYDAEGVLNIEEDYLLYPEGFEAAPCGLAYTIPFTPRGEGQVKNESAWAEYVEHGVEAGESKPAVFISLPDQDTRVFVSLLTSDGGETDKLEISSWSGEGEVGPKRR